ncbi:MAG: hypothetical protein AB1486_32725 [Planctomycetota bacterium]
MRRDHEHTAPRRSLDDENRLSAAAGALREPVEAPGLWEKIEAALASEAGHNRRRRWSSRRRLVLAFAAALPAAAAIMLFATGALAPDSSASPGPLLDAEEALALAGEQARVDAETAALELASLRGASARAGSLEEALVRDHLAFVEENLAMLKAVARENPFNRGIQQSLVTCSRQRLSLVRQLVPDTVSNKESPP